MITRRSADVATKRALLLAALAAVAPAVLGEHPRGLTQITDGITYVLAEDFVATEKAATFTLKAGEYVAAFENDTALFLLGGPDCLEMHVVPPKQPEHAYTMPFACGIRYPKAATEEARFFVVRGVQPHNREYGLIVNLIIKAGEGNFDYPISRKSVVGLRPRLVAGTQPPGNAPDAQARDAKPDDGGRGPGS